MRKATLIVMFLLMATIAYAGFDVIIMSGGCGDSSPCADHDETSAIHLIENNPWVDMNITYMGDDGDSNWSSYNGSSNVIIYFSSGDTGQASTKLRDMSQGVVLTGDSIYDEMDLCTGDSPASNLQWMNVTNSSHPITDFLSLGNFSYYEPNSNFIYCSGKASGANLLGRAVQTPSIQFDALIAFENQSTGVSGNPLQGRRVVHGARSEHLNDYTNDANRTFINSIWWAGNTSSAASGGGPANATDNFPGIDSLFPASLTNFSNITGYAGASTIDDDFILVNVSLYVNSTLNQTNTSGIQGKYNFSLDASPGTYEWYLVACDNSSQCNTSATRTLIFSLGDVTPLPPTDNDPVLSAIFPLTGVTVINASALINFSATDDYAIDNVSLYVAGALNQTNTSGFNGSYTFELFAAIGSYSWYLEACDNASQCVTNSARTITFSDGSTPASSPSAFGATTRTVILAISILLATAVVSVVLTGATLAEILVVVVSVIIAAGIIAGVLN